MGLVSVSHFVLVHRDIDAELSSGIPDTPAVFTVEQIEAFST
jgi:hypothetical protein